MNKIFFKYFTVFICMGVLNVIYAQGKEKSFNDVPGADLRVFNNYESSGHTIHNYIDSLITESWITWKKNYELRKSPEERAKHYEELKENFIKAIGGLPERTP